MSDSKSVQNGIALPDICRPIRRLITVFVLLFSLTAMATAQDHLAPIVDGPSNGAKTPQRSNRLSADTWRRPDVSPAQPAVSQPPTLTKDRTVSAPSARRGKSDSAMTPAEARRLAQRRGLKKDLTVSAPGSKTLDVNVRPSEAQPRRYSNLKTARLPFMVDPHPSETHSAAPPHVYRADTDRENLDVNAAMELPIQAEASDPLENESTVEIEIVSDEPIDTELSVIQTEPADEWLSADGETWIDAESQHGMVHASLPENCLCTTAIAELWRPEGIDAPWPPDEYICDGGDADVRVAVNKQSQVLGLGLEDTVAHYDTADGRTLVTPSNSVCIYAPRFAAVRKVMGTREDDRLLRPRLCAQPLPPVVEELTRPPLVVAQPIPPQRLLDIDGPLALRDRRRGLELDQSLRVAELVRDFQAYEDYQVMRIGIDKGSDKARIIEHITAAIEWSRAETPEVIIDRDAALVDTTAERTGVVYQLESGPPCLRIIKLANRHAALPGEIVEFTLRYDNIGDQTVDNVAIIDNLTIRLEYVPGSSQSNRKAEFFSDENEGESLVLRWEINEPLRPGDGGLIRFKCKVR